MPSEYDPLRPRTPLSSQGSDLDRVRDLFSRASVGYLRSPWPWFAWALILPGAAFLTPHIAAATGPGSLAVLLVWSVAILIGGAIEGLAMRSGGAKAARSDVTGWVFRAQGNLSLIAIALTGVVVANRAYDYLPGIWLLLIGHSFYTVGGLASNALKRSGLLYQLGGLVSLLPGLDSLTVFALTTAVANASVAVSLLRRAGDG